METATTIVIAITLALVSSGVGAVERDWKSTAVEQVRYDPSSVQRFGPFLFITTNAEGRITRKQVNCSESQKRYLAPDSAWQPITGKQKNFYQALCEVY